MFHSGRKPMRPSAGLSRPVFWPFQAARALSSEPYFFISHWPNSASSIRSCGSGMFSAENVQKKYESSLMISTPNTAGSATSGLPVCGLGVCSSAFHHVRYFAWKSSLKYSAANGCFVPS